MKKHKCACVVLMLIGLAVAIGIGCSRSAWAEFLVTQMKASLLETCAHQSWTEGVCDICSYECPHEKWQSGVCSLCGIGCEHDNWNDGVCERCGFICPHYWDGPVCQRCGSVCVHKHFNEGGFCSECDYECPHESFSEGACNACGFHCDHVWQDGLCLICGLQCLHRSHNQQTRECLDCGERVIHSFVGGRCECGEQPIFYQEPLGIDMFYGSDQMGTVEHLQYTTALEGVGDPVTKQINVYLPYGYDASQQYDVLLMIHGGGGCEDDWTDTWFMLDSVDAWIQMKNVYDYLIAQETIRPLIIVTPSTSAFVYENRIDSDEKQFAKEIREVILPYICDHYATYAASGSIEDIRAARSHFGIGGESNGALYAYSSGMEYNFDLFSNFICLSGNHRPKQVAEAINSEEYKDLPIACLYAGAGRFDNQRDNAIRGYRIITDSTERLEDGKNAYYIDIYGTGHNWKTWTSSIVNALQVVFPNEDNGFKTGIKRDEQAKLSTGSADMNGL